VFTGPHGFNFRETFETLERVGALSIGTTPRELSDYWLATLSDAQPRSTGAVFASSRVSFEKTLAAILAMLAPKDVLNDAKGTTHHA
jgi:hypothetical protein